MDDWLNKLQTVAQDFGHVFQQPAQPAPQPQQQMQPQATYQDAMQATPYQVKPQDFIQNAGDTVKNALGSLGIGLNSFLDHQWTPGGSSINQAIGDVMQHPDNYNLYSQMAKGNLNTGLPWMNRAEQPIGQFANNYVAQPAIRAVDNLSKAVNPTNGEGGWQRAGQAAIGGMNALALTPGGAMFNTTAAPAWNAELNALQSARTGSDNSPVHAMIQGLLGNKTPMLGDALTDNKTLATIGNIAQLPAMIAMSNPRGTVSLMKNLSQAVQDMRAGSMNPALALAENESGGINPDAKVGMPTLEDLQNQGGRPQSQSIIEDLINKGDFKGAQKAINVLDDKDPYKAPMQNILNTEQSRGVGGVDEFQQQVLDKNPNPTTQEEFLPGETPAVKNPDAVAQLEKDALTNAPKSGFKSTGADEFTPPGGVVGKFNNVMNPLGNQSPDFQNAIQEWNNTIQKGNARANMENLNFAQLSDKLGLNPKQEWALVNYSQNPTPEGLAELQGRKYNIDPATIQKAEALLNLNKTAQDARYQAANENNVYTNYLENHIRQAYSNTPQEVQDALSGKGMMFTPGFAKQRYYDNYLQAMDAGLTPKYTTFGQLNALDTQQLHQAIADRQLQTYLVKSNSILPASEAPKGWQPILSDRFPRASDKQPYYAPPDKAAVINNIFGGQQPSPVSKGLNIAGKVSAKLQSLLLSTPGYSIHGFTIANMFRDVATGAADALSGHPIRGFNTATSGIGAALRAFVPGAAGDFEKAHASSIEQMGSEGIGYTGKFNYKEMQPNVLNPDSLLKIAKDAPGNIEKALIAEPTFQKFMFQRKVSLFENFRDSLASQGYSSEDAVSQAAAQLKAYDGVVNNLGRNPDVNNFLKTFFFAPRYREGIINAQVNAVKGLLDFGNKDYDMSRRLGFGLGLTFLAYNALNEKNTGHPMWQNASGHEFDVAFHNSQDPTKDYYVPWMPGTTTVPRAIAGTGLALAKGDSKTAGQQASGILSSPIQTLSQAASGKDYFGRDIFDQSKPLLPQQAGYVAKQMLPGGANEVSKFLTDQYAGKNPNPQVATARVFQLPIKEGSNGDNSQVTQQSQYFNIRDQVMQSLKKPQQDDLTYFNQSQANGGPTAKEKAQIVFNKSNDWIIPTEQKIQLASNPNDPLWSRSPDDIKAYYAYEAETDPKIKAQLQLANPWMYDVQKEIGQNAQNSIAQANDKKTQSYDNTQNSILYKMNNPMINSFLGAPAQVQPPQLTQLNPQSPPSPKDQLTADQRQVATAYTALPGTASTNPAKRQLLDQNPWLSNYWNQESSYFQQNPIKASGPLADYLTSQGIDPNTNTGTGSSFGSGGGGGMSSAARRRMRIRPASKPKPIRVAHMAAPPKPSKLLTSLKGYSNITTKGKPGKMFTIKA